MILAEIRKSNPNSNTVKVLNYLSDLSSTTGIEIGSWDINKVFGEELVFSAREINKRFFAHAKQQERAKKSQLPEKYKQDLLDASRHLRPQEMRKLESDCVQVETSIRNNQLQFEQLAVKLRTYREQIAMMGEKKSDFVEQIKEILDQGFWEIEKINTQPQASRLVIFKTNEITLKWPQKDGRDFSLNFGRLLFAIHSDGLIRSFQKEEQPYARVFSRGYYYPFISGEGSICWGSASSAAADLQAKGKFADAFLLLQRLCQSYSDDGPPYESLAAFFINGRDKDGNAPWLVALTPEKRKLYGITETTWKVLKARLNNEAPPEGVNEISIECDECGHEWEEFVAPGDTARCPECDFSMVYEAQEEFDTDDEEDDSETEVRVEW